MATRRPVVVVNGTLQELPVGDDLPGSGGGGGVIVSDTEPAPEIRTNGLKWVDGVTGVEYTWVEDGTSGQWVEFGPGLSPAHLLPSDFSSLTTDASLDGNETVAFSGGFKSTLTAIFAWFLARANTWGGVQTVKGVVETVYAIPDSASVDINPSNGTIQTWTLGANRTPTALMWASGQGVALMVDDGAAATINWATIGVTWLTADGNAPVLKTTGYTTIVLWKVGTTMYGK